MDRQDSAHVRRAGTQPSLAQVLTGGTDQLHLSRVQVRLEDQRGEPVAVHRALPSSGERLGEQRQQLVQVRILDSGEHEAVRRIQGQMIDENEAEVLEEREHLRQRRPGARPADDAPERGLVRLPHDVGRPWCRRHVGNCHASLRNQTRSVRYPRRALVGHSGWAVRLRLRTACRVHLHQSEGPTSSSRTSAWHTRASLHQQAGLIPAPRRDTGVERLPG